MTISSEISRMDYVGNGVTTIHPYTFKIVDQTHLVVTKRVLGVEIDLTLTTDYTVSGVGAQGGGNVTLVAPLDNGIPLVIRRVVPVLQSTDIKNQGAFYPEIHEDEFDAIVMMVQQQQEEINRSVKVPVTGGSTPETYLASLSAFVTAFLAGIADVAAAIHAAGSKATPVGADEFGIWDSVSGLLKKVTLTNLIATLGTSFAALAGLASQVFSVGTATSAAHAIRLEQERASFRNAAVNGDMSVSQVNGTTLVTTGVGADTYVIDQHIVRATGAAVTAGQSTDATGCPTGFGTNLKISGAASNTNVTHKHRIEAKDARRFAGKRIAVSVWLYQDSGAAMAGATVKAFCPTTTADTFSALTQEGSTQTFSIANAGTIAKYTQFIQMGASNVARGLEIDIDLNAALLAGKTCYIAGYQIEAVANDAAAGTYFEFIPYTEQLKRCQRFYWQAGFAGTGYGPYIDTYQAAGNTISIYIQHPVPMRAAPTLTKVGTWTVGNCTQPAANFPTILGFLISSTVTALGRCAFYPSANTDGITCDARL